MYTKYQAATARPGPEAPVCILVYFVYNNIFDKSTDSKPHREPPYQFEPSDRYDCLRNVWSSR